MKKARVANRRSRRAAHKPSQAAKEQQKLDDALRDSFPASDPVSFLEPCGGETKKDH